MLRGHGFQSCSKGGGGVAEVVSKKGALLFLLLSVHAHRILTFHSNAYEFIKVLKYDLNAMIISL